ncbi:flavin monoamine oxidase family protein [Sphingomonas oleivorans]|uniref:flavin monoamine oxidase family protein n=1 Tax=Sphingomonas oleivorans TaxID=1735121 RepID=UPI002434BFEE|nr:FAD-dependent oxidoreductase [Sphingomonas oleivorans]
MSFAGAVGGYGAVVGAMSAMGMDPIPAAANAEAPSLAPGSGKGRRVAILGAGIAGLVSAYELRKAGYEVIVLESRDRVGGRNWTVRRGTRIDFADGSSQSCEWDEGLYFNAGPGRIPSHHKIMHGYIRELGVPLEVEINSSRSAYVLPKDGGPIQLRRLFNDTRGHVAELLSKCTSQGALDQALSADDRKALIDFMRIYGDLGADGRYTGSSRSGYKVRPGAGDFAGTKVDPLDLKTLLNPVLWAPLAFEEAVLMQPTMFQPVGGMDRIPLAFYERLKPVVRLGAQVQEIRNHSNGVEIAYRDAKNGAVQTIRADYAVATIPLPVLRAIPNNFSKPFAQAMAAIEYDHAEKIAWQAPRFWETESEVYGGLSFIEGDTSIVWYPSSGFNEPQGVLVGAYSSGKAAERLTAKPLAAQFAESRDVIERLHPGCGKLLGRPLSVQWKKIPHNLGPWAHIEEAQAAQYAALGRPEGRVYLAGDYLSHISGWQEGAASSALRAVSMIGERVASAATPLRKAG